MESTWTKRLYVSAPQTSAHRAPLPRRLGKGRAVRVPDLRDSVVPPGYVEWHRIPGNCAYADSRATR